MEGVKGFLDGMRVVRADTCQVGWFARYFDSGDETMSTCRAVSRASARARGAAAVIWLLLALPSTGSGQSLPDVPPLPREERLLQRADLTATLHVSAADIVAGERPDLSLVLTNRSRERLRVADASVNFTTSVRAYDASGEVLPRMSTIIDRVVLPRSVATLPVLNPGESRAFSVSSDVNVPGPLPVGEYVFRVTYVNRAGSPHVYDVYEPGAEDVWEGDLTASVTVRVRPLDAASERRLIQEVREGSPTAAAAAIRALGLSRAEAAVDPIVERFERDYNMWRVVFESLGYIATPHAARALAAAYGRIPTETPLRMIIASARSSRDVHGLARGAGCDALVLSALTWPSQATASTLRDSCPKVAELLRAEVASQETGRTLTRPEAERQQWAAAMLKPLESPEPPPAPTEYPRDRLPPPPVAERLLEYVAAIVGFPGGHSEDVAVELSGIARFGTHDTFTALRAALSTASDETAYVIAEALRALTFEDEWLPLVDRAEELRRWDRWWQQHGRETREVWARDAIGRRPEISMSASAVNGASRAAEYLMALDRKQYEQVLVTHRSWRVRVTAAVFLAAGDPPYAAALLLRELENRYWSACANAGDQLAHLTGSWFPFKCHSAQERRAAAAHWTRLALALR